MSRSTPEQLNEFINQARSAGRQTLEIKESLVKAGWSPETIQAALPDNHGDLIAPAPPAPKTPGREVFFALLTFFTLGITAVSLGGVIFSLINKAFPDLTVVYYYQSREVTSPLSALIVASPIFIWLSWKFTKDVTKGLVSVRSGIRKILTYIALFIASATVIGDVIALVYRFLAGEVNTRFILKVVTILLIGAWIVWYYWMNLKREEKNENAPTGWYRWHGIALLAVIILTIAGGFYLSGTPEKQRALVRDQRRVDDLQSIYYNVQDYYARQQAMPALTDLQQGYLNNFPADPSTGENYDYIVGDGSNFKLCAEFETDDANLNESVLTKPAYGPYDLNWTHPAGEYCFDLEAKSAK